MAKKPKVKNWDAIVAQTYEDYNKDLEDPTTKYSAPADFFSSLSEGYKGSDKEKEVDKAFQAFITEYQKLCIEHKIYILDNNLILNPDLLPEQFLSSEVESSPVMVDQNKFLFKGIISDKTPDNKIDGKLDSKSDNTQDEVK